VVVRKAILLPLRMREWVKCMPVSDEERGQKSEELLGKLQEKLGDYILESGVSLGDAEVRIRAEGVSDFFRLLKLDSELAFNMFLDVTAVDWMDEREDRFEVVYHMLSLSTHHRLRVKVDLPEQSPRIASVSQLWAGANFLEREVFDMYGIEFEGHPDLRRILMYDEFKGYPLRKDYPVQGKQPRIPLRAPEVENTARHMHRSELVQIGRG